jgi:hypothetical protein
MVQYKFQAEFGGISINRDGVFRARFTSPFIEAGEILQTLRLWTGKVATKVETRKRTIEAEFILDGVNFKPDGTVSVVLRSDSRALGDQGAHLIRLRKGKMVGVSVSPASHEETEVK